MPDDFLQELYSLLEKYHMRMDVDLMQDINLAKGNIVIGYWEGVIKPYAFVSLNV